MRPAAEARATLPEERARGFRFLFFCLLCIGMGQSLMFAVLPPIARELGLSEVGTSAIFSFSALCWVLMSPFWGGRSDVWGRKPVILVGLMGFGVSTLGFAAVVGLGLMGVISGAAMLLMLILVRSIFGIFGSGSMPAAYAYVADRTTPGERATGMATIAAAFGMGTVLGPGFAAALVVLGLLAPFLAVGALALGSAVFIWRFLPERMPPREPTAGYPRIRLRDSRAAPFLIMGLLVSLAQSILMQTAAFYFMDELHLNPDAPMEAAQLVGVALMAMALATLFAQLVLVAYFRLPVLFLIRWGAAASLLTFLLMVLGGSYGVLVTALVLAGLALGLLRPGLAAAASLTVSAEEQGAIAGLMGATGAAGHVLTPFISMPLYGIMHEGPFLLGAALMAGLVLFALTSPAVRNVRAEATEEHVAPS